MAYSLCPPDRAAVPDPAQRTCTSCRGRLTGVFLQDRPTPTAARPMRTIPPGGIAAGLILVLAVAAFLVQALFLHPVAVPMAANVSTSATPPLIAPVPFPPPPSAVTLKILTTTPSYSSYPAVTGSSKEIPLIDATSLETRIHGLVNQVRQEHGLAALGTDTALTSLARAHSADMASNGYFGHVNLRERDATARGAAAGYTCHKTADPYFTYPIAENLYATYRSGPVLLDGQATGSAWTTEEAMAEETVKAWMDSPDHRDNILDAGIGREGIGVAFGQGDMVFVTQDFC